MIQPLASPWMIFFGKSFSQQKLSMTTNHLSTLLELLEAAKPLEVPYQWVLNERQKTTPQERYLYGSFWQSQNIVFFGDDTREKVLKAALDEYNGVADVVEEKSIDELVEESKGELPF